jgi:glycosyltransferase involved in cell wall biosynthesis
VDEADPEKLAQEIIRLLSDSEMQKLFSENAYSRAKDDFDLPVAQKKFYDLFNL